MSLEALADAMQVDPSDIVRTLFMKGIMLSLNQVGSGGGGQRPFTFFFPKERAFLDGVL